MGKVLARIQLHDQLLVDHRLHFVTRWNARDLSAERVPVRDQPIWNRRDLRKLEVTQSKLAGFRFVLYKDLVTRLHVKRSNVYFPAIHLNVAMGNELTCRAPGVREAKPENNVIEPRFEKLQQRFAGNATLAQGVLKNTAKLAFEKSVLVAKLLLFTERDGIIGLLTA